MRGSQHSEGSRRARQFAILATALTVATCVLTGVASAMWQSTTVPQIRPRRACRDALRFGATPPPPFVAGPPPPPPTPIAVTLPLGIFSAPRGTTPEIISPPGLPPVLPGPPVSRVLLQNLT